MVAESPNGNYVKVAGRTPDLTERGFNADRFKFLMKATLCALRLNELLELFADKSISCPHEVLDETNTLS